MGHLWATTADIEDNTARSLLGRTLDDKANRRVIRPDAFLTNDELLRRAHRILRGLRIYDEAVARNLIAYGTFAATERLPVELARTETDRQAMHERIRQHAMDAWQAVWASGPNILVNRLAADPEVLRYLPADRVRELLDPRGTLATRRSGHGRWRE